MAAASLGGLSALRECFDLHLFLAFLPVSLCFATGLSLKMMAVNHFQAGTIKIVGQLRLPMLALLSTVLLARKYSVVQWQVIAMITTSCMSFVLLKGQGRHDSGKRWKWTGLSQLFAWVVLNVLGGIAAERAYKTRGSPFYAQKVSEDFGHLLVALVMLLVIVPHFNPDENILNQKCRPHGFFDSWDARTVVVVIFLFLDAWIGNMLLKEFSGVTRSVAKAFAISVVYFVSFFYAKDRKRNPALTLVAILVVQSSLLFAFIQ
uniref:Sugar phosphate transporter domain-containing protein n=1 Tax=Pyrodinium bahamense TaxID=73915 RepID=A0A7S0A9L7_9DINO